MPGAVEWAIDERQLAAFRKGLERYRGLPLERRLGKGTLAAARYLARPIRAATPRGPTGNLRRSVGARQARRRVGLGRYEATMGAYVGPTAPHRHLVIRGHRIVTRGGRDTGRRARADPYVDAVVRAHAAEAFRIVSRALFGS